MENINLLNHELTYYEVFGVERDATPQEIKRAYRKLAISFHPDKHVNSPEKEIAYAEQVMARANKIYSVLMDEDNRLDYDTNGEVDEKKSRYATKENSPIFDELFRSIEIPMEHPYTVLTFAQIKPAQAILGGKIKVIVYDEENGDEVGTELEIVIPSGVTTNTILTYFDMVQFKDRTIPSNVAVALSINSSKKLEIQENNIIVNIPKDQVKSLKTVAIGKHQIILPKKSIVNETNGTFTYKNLGIENKIENITGDLIVRAV